MKYEVRRPWQKNAFLEFRIRPRAGERVRTFDDGGLYTVKDVLHYAQPPGASEKTKAVIILVEKPPIAWGIPPLDTPPPRRHLQASDRNASRTAVTGPDTKFR